MTASDHARAIARLSEVGLSSIHATIAAPGRGGSVRELPKISVDLHSTQAARPQASLPSIPRPERDLEVISALGEGGMGRVLLARQHSLDREVAIKTLHIGASEDERAALIAEGAITGHLEHPGIVPVHALGLDGDGRPVLVMKRVEGVEWTVPIERGEPLARHLEILIQVCNAVEFAHSRQIVHRDIKPQNVLIGRYGDVYLCDWGLAVRIDRPWQPQPLCGTPGYMAPEMVLGLPVDERTDVYLLGATLHYVLTGRPRNDGEDARAASLASLDAGPFAYPASVPEELAAIANRATACEPGDRLPTVAALRQAVVDYVQHGSSRALARSAAGRVDDLRHLAEAGLGDEESQRGFERLAVEARFGIDQARAQWADNPIAADADAALETLLAGRRARAAELERLARDLDPAPLGPQRAIAFGTMAAVGVVLTVIGVAGYPAMPTPERMFAQSLIPSGVLLAVLVATRRQLAASAFNRRLAVASAAMVCGISLSRGLALVAGTPTPTMLLQDAILAAITLGVGASYLFRWMAWPALLILGVAMIAAASPRHAHLAFSIGSGVAFVVVAVFGSRRRNRAGAT